MTVEELQIIISMRTEKVRAQVDRVKRKVAEIQPKKTAELDVNTRQAQGNLKKLQADIERTQAKISKLTEKMNGIFAQQDAIASQYKGLPNITGMTPDQSLDYMVGNDPRIQKLNSQLDKLDAQTAPLKAHLEEVKAKITAAGNAAEPAAEKTRRLGQSLKNTEGHIQKAGRSSGYFSRMVKSMLFSMVLYSGVSLVFGGIAEGMQNTALSSAQTNETISQLATSALYLKNSVAAALMPALQALTPVIVQIADGLAWAFNMFGMLTARIFNHASSVTIAKKANVDYAATLNKTKQVADAAKKSIMGFDEINSLSHPATAAAASGTPGMPDAGMMFETVKVPPWIEKIGKITDKIGQIKNKIRASLSEITAITSGFLLALGAILLLTGVNVPLGLGLMAAGAIGLATTVSANWGSMSKSLLNTLATITAAVGGFTLALGAILALSGANIPLGIGLMVVGATSLAASIGITWGHVKADVSTVLSAITGVVSGAALALGALFALTGVDVPLGIGLMLAGAVGLASTVALNWNGMSAETKDSLSTITAIVSGSMLALGAVLTLTGVAPALGIPMMVVGASALATTVAVNWNSMSTQLKTTLTAVTAIIGGFTLALGAALAFSGVGIPLGIALIAIGATSLATSVALNWDAVKNILKDTLASITAIISVSLVAIGLMLCLTGAGIPLGIGLILAGMAGTHTAASINKTPITDWAKGVVNGIIDIFESGVNFIISMLNRLSFTVPDWAGEFGGKTFGINISPVNIPRLANGGLITGPTYSLIGEGKDHEAVLPLNSGVYSQLAQGIVDNGGTSGTDTDRIVERLAALEKAILERPVQLYANNRAIAESANAGNRLLGRARPPIASN